MTIEPAIGVALISLAVAILGIVIGIVYKIARWIAKQEGYSTANAKGIIEIKNHLGTMNGSILANKLEIVNLKSIAHAPKE